MKIKFVFTAILLASTATASQLQFPYINGNGFTTTLVLNNPSGSAISIPTTSAAGRRTRVSRMPAYVDAHTTLRVDAWPEGGGGVASFEVMEGLEAYVEITDGEGRIARFSGDTMLQGNEAIQFQDLHTTKHDSYVLVFAEEASRVIVNSFLNRELWSSQSLDVAAGETRIIQVPTGANRVRAGVDHAVGSGRIYVVAYISDRSAGSMIPLRGLRLTGAATPAR